MIDQIVHRFGVIHLELFARLSSHSWRRLPHPPFEPAVARGPGHDPDRVLLTGRTAGSWGVVSHDIGLGGQLARATAAITGRGIDVEIEAAPGLSLPAIERLLTPSTISRYDAIVLTVGIREAMELMPVATWTRQLTSLLDHIESGRELGPAVIVVGVEERLPVPITPGISRLVLARARALNHASREVIASRPRVWFQDSGLVPERDDGSTLLDSDKPQAYTRDALTIAPTLAAVLEESPARLRHPVDEEARSRAVEHVRSRDRSEDPLLLQALTAIKEVLHMRSADLFFVDRNTVQLLAATTGTAQTRPREQTLSSEALEYRSGLVIHDLSAHERLRTLPEVTGPPFLRFYAAHPVESPDGHRVAVLSIVDTMPRAFTARESSILRQFALQVGSILFADY